jgi:tRNA threonylcarbamoyl adenosine modification protein YeaZ
MKGLILDTSHQAFIAISSYGKLLASFTCSPHCSSTFVQDIHQCLKNSSLLLSDIEYIAIGIGPGSFLGTRIGVIVAKSLAYALSIPLVTFCSLEAYQTQPPFCVLSDAKSKGAYLLNSYHNSKPLLLNPQELEEFSLNNPLFISPTAHTLLNKFSFLTEVNCLQATPCLPYLCQYAYEKHLSSHLEKQENLEIHYLRLS